MTTILRILAWLWPAREHHMPYDYWPKGDLATGQTWRYRIARRPSVRWMVQGRKRFGREFPSIRRMWGCGNYHPELS